MKKFLSVALSAAMLLSVMLGFSVQAEPYEDYVYVFEDFENGTLGNVSKQYVSNLSYADGGVGGSRGSALVEIKSKQYSDLSVPCAKAPNAGQMPVFSAWIKLDNSDLTSQNVSFIIYGNVNIHKTDSTVDGENVKTANAWKQLTVSNTGIKKGEWVYVSAEGSWDGRMQCNSVIGYDGFTENGKQCMTSDIANFTRFAIRVGQWGGTDDLPDDSEETSVRYYIDDIRYECVPVEETEKIEIGENIVDCGEFDEYSDTLKSRVSSNYEIVCDENDPAPDGSAGYLKFVPKSDSDVRFTEYHQTVTWKTNHVYKVSYYMKFFGPLKDGSEDTAKVNTQESGKSVEELETKTSGAWLLQVATAGRGRIADTNGYNKDYPGCNMGNVADAGGGWQKVEYYYVHEYKTFTEQPFEMWLRLYVGTNSNLMNNGIFGLDSFKMIDLGPISNGDFEIGTAELRKTGTAVSQNVLGWTESDAVSEQSDDVRSESGSEHSMKVTVSSDEGYVYQGINMKDGKRYKISFWAKGENLEVEAPFALVMDRYVPSAGGEMESYDVPNYQYITGKEDVCEDYTDDVKAEQDWKLSNEWKYYECYYDNGFELKEGLTEANKYTFPRLPFMYFDVNGNAANTTYFLDDIEITCVGEAGVKASTPVVTNFTVEGDFIPGEDVSVAYNFSSPDGYSDASMVRMMCKVTDDRYVSFGSFKANDIITVPFETVGKEVMFEIVPVDSEGNCGEALMVAPSDPGAWTVLKVDNETLLSTVYTSEPVSGTLVYAAYKNKQLISVKPFDVKTEAYDIDNIYSLSDLGEFSSEDVDIVKVMFIDDYTGLKPLCSDTIIDYTAAP